MTLTPCEKHQVHLRTHLGSYWDSFWLLFIVSWAGTNQSVHMALSQSMFPHFHILVLIDWDSAHPRNSQNSQKLSQQLPKCVLRCTKCFSQGLRVILKSFWVISDVFMAALIVASPWPCPPKKLSLTPKNYPNSFTNVSLGVPIAFHKV